VAWDLTSLISALEKFDPDVILLNIATQNLPLLLSATTSLSTAVPVIAIAACEDVEDAVVACAEAGVAGYHLRADSFHELLELIGDVTSGRTQCPPEVSAMLLRRLSELASFRQPAPKEPVLTARENQILGLLELGRSNQDIAEQLSIAVHTVKNHVHSLLTKLGVGTRAEAAALAHALRVGRDAQEGPRPRSSKSWPS
jgi:DNA-binding NarL/FixJ family response regulator